MDENERLRLLKEEALNDVRQSLALERTILANERTLLSYIRTAVALSGSGLTIQHFSHTLFFNILGWVLVPLGLLMALLGYRQYRKLKQTIARDKRLLGLRLR
jgi:putative membrane protein